MDRDMSAGASFSIKTYTISASAGSGGTISPSGSASADHGSSRSYTVTPDEGYKLHYLRIDGKNKSVTDNAHTFSNIKGKHSIVAYFKKIDSGSASSTKASTLSNLYFWKL